jgi:hypothetical protein
MEEELRLTESNIQNGKVWISKVSKHFLDTGCKRSITTVTKKNIIKCLQFECFQQQSWSGTSSENFKYKSFTFRLNTLKCPTGLTLFYSANLGTLLQPLRARGRGGLINVQCRRFSTYPDIRLMETAARSQHINCSIRWRCPHPTAQVFYGP